jgi:hypothetical protein
MLSFRPGPNGTLAAIVVVQPGASPRWAVQHGRLHALGDQQGAPGCQLSQHGDKYRWTGANYPCSSRTNATIAKEQMEHVVDIRYTMTRRIGGSALARR